VADQLRRIERAGSTRPLLYAVRDVRGVETPEEAPTERSGFNEEAEWTGRADKAINCEHDAEGKHVGLKYAKCVIVLTSEDDGAGGTTWGVDGKSWRDGKLQRIDPFVSLSGDVLTFDSPWFVAGTAVVIEGVGQIVATVTSTTTIEIDRSRVADPLMNGGHIVLSIHEAA
jgi:hypothetical protein